MISPRLAVNDEASPQWGGEKDYTPNGPYQGVPGCLRERGLVLDRIFVRPVPGACSWCGGTEMRRLPPDEHHPKGRPVCQRCHPWERRTDA